jgi:DNA polymerase-3 subunit gamma/tau
MATLIPVVPINDILERLKAMEKPGSGGMVASPPPRWENRSASRDRVPPPDAAKAPPSDKAKPLPPWQETEKTEARKPEATDSQRSAAEPWDGFVAFVKGKKPMLASLLDHGHPLRVSETLLEIGFPEGSFQLNSLQDPAAMTELQGLAKAFFRADTGFRLIPLAEVSTEVPATLLGKKTLDEANRVQMIRQVAESHPLVAAALEIFGGEIEAIGEADETKKK